MSIHRILTPERTFHGVQGVSKKKILEFIAEQISSEVPAIHAKELFQSLIARERLGTTGLGHGIAIPHCRCKACPEPTGLFMHLKEPVDYDAIDREPVDLIFALIVPEGENQEHLDTLRALAERFQSEQMRENLRRANGAYALYQSLIT